MGWLFKSELRSAKAVHKHLLEQLSSVEVLAHAATNFGRHFYAATPKGIFVALVSSSDGWWGYKDMSEAMGPTIVDCPLFVLDAAPDPECSYSTEWRNRVRKFHERNKRKLAPGHTFLTRQGYYQVEYRLRGFRNAYAIVRQSDGAAFRATIQQINSMEADCVTASSPSIESPLD
jgi:hypothetical protein